MPKNDGPRLPSGIVTENSLTALLRRFGVRLEQSEELDHVRKIDALITAIEPIAKHAPTPATSLGPIGLQITQRQKDISKIDTWLRNATKGTTGPVLYAEIYGEVTAEMAMGLRHALLALWIDLTKRHRRTHAIELYGSGEYTWFNPRKAVRRARERKRRG